MTLKSYLSNAEREELRRDGLTENGIFLAESEAAGDAGDEDTAWAWLARAELPAHTLAFLKDRRGATFIREMGFKTTNADAAYGANWLDQQQE